MKKSRLRCGCEFGPFWYGKFWELKSWKYRPNGVRNLFKIDKNLENITKTAPQIDEKSRLRFWSVFGAALGRQLGGYHPKILGSQDPKTEPKGAQRPPKVSQGATKKHQKIDLRFWTVFWASKGGVAPTIFGPHLATIFDQKSKKASKKAWKKGCRKSIEN